MKYVSKIFQPLHVYPKDAKVVVQEALSKSQKLLSEMGYVRGASPGFFAWLPLGTRVLHKLERLARAAMESAGAQQMILPTLTAESLWQRSGRLHAMPGELLALKDRHGKGYILSPTHEEAVTALLGSHADLSYRQLPLTLYQITSKFRDELHPRHGVLRAREFLMKDAYSFDADEGAARDSYSRMMQAYARFFDALQVPYSVVEADNGAMGGSVSHEWHVHASIGTDAVARCGACGRAGLLPGAAQRLGPPACPHCRDTSALTVTNGIEVGHTFLLGDRYSKALGLNYVTREGSLAPPCMGCYGVGLSRAAAAAAEALSPPERLVWPRALAPYTVCLLGPKLNSKEESAWPLVERLHDALSLALPSLQGDIVIDDRRQLTIGKRLLEAIRTGYPYVIIVAKAAMDTSNPKFELQDTATGETQILDQTGLIQKLREALETGKCEEDKPNAFDNDRLDFLKNVA